MPPFWNPMYSGMWSSSISRMEWRIPPDEPRGDQSPEEAAGHLERHATRRACLSGDEEAWSSLIGKYKALMYSIPVKYGLSRQVAADGFQTTCTELLVPPPELLV